jgi:hypothetical protein
MGGQAFPRDASPSCKTIGSVGALRSALMSNVPVTRKRDPLQSSGLSRAALSAVQSKTSAVDIHR